MTSGWRAVTNGSWRESPRSRMQAAWVSVAAFGLLHVIVNATTVLDERARTGSPIETWEPWVWEASSTLVWLAMLPLIFVAAGRLQPPRIGVVRAIGVHLLLTLPVSLIHVVAMNLARFAIYAAAGDRYGPRQPFIDTLVYEYRKDLITYVLLVGFFLLFDRVVRPHGGPQSRDDLHRIEVRDRSRTHWIAPHEIDWAQAAGNYVELNGRFGCLLHRTTLAALEQELAPFGFVRVHRSRLVRKAAVQAVETKPSGDFELALTDGTRVGGSRRFQERL